MNTVLFTENIYKVSTVLPHEAILSELKSKLYKPVPPSGEDYDTMQFISDNNVLDKIVLGSQVKKIVEAEVDKAVKSFGYDNEAVMATSWANCIRHGNRSEFHAHQNFWLSAVYYPHGKVADNFTIVFKKNDLNYYDIRKKSHNAFNTNMVAINVKEGDLIIFPSYMQHKIGYNHSKLDRYSLAMNFLPAKTIGHKDGETTLDRKSYI